MKVMAFWSWVRVGVWVGTIRAAVVYASIGLAEEPLTNPQRLHVATLVPLTGSAAEQGQWIVDGLSLAAEALRQEVRVLVDNSVEETGADPKRAIAAYRAIMSQSSKEKGVPRVVFTYGSGVGVALSPLTNADQVVQFGLATASPAYRSENDLTFRNFPSAEQETRYLAERCKNHGAAKIVVLKIRNEYGAGMANSFRKALEETKGKLVAEFDLEPQASDYRSLLLQVRSIRPDVLVLFSYPTEGALVLKQWRDLGGQGQWYASAAVLGGSEFLSIAGKAAEGVLVSTSRPNFLDPQDLSQAEFTKAFRRLRAANPGPEHIYTARAYDALMLVGKAAQVCGIGRDELSSSCLRDQLFSVAHYHGASGILSFDRAGDVTTPFVFVSLLNGVFRIASED